jgi:hypothetical protein
MAQPGVWLRRKSMPGKVAIGLVLQFDDGIDLDGGADGER